MIVVVDYRKGNLLSVVRGLEAQGAEAIVSDDPRVIADASALVLPGVGAFADASESMLELGQMSVIRQRITEGVPFLGICLGMHLMFEEGIEGSPEEDDEISTHNAQGLAILPGVVDKLPSYDEAGQFYKIPHVGWNTVEPAVQLETRSESAGATSGASAFASPLFAGIDPGEYFYFTHSYKSPEGACTIAQTTHSVTFPSAVQYKDYVFGVQFHPEKSSDAGALLLRNFIDIAKGA